MDTKSVNNKFVKLIKKNNEISRNYAKNKIEKQLSKKANKNIGNDSTKNRLNLKQKKK